VVEHRIFAGLTADETATLLGVSRPTVERDWRAARAWLAVELEAAP
jgi:DNA-directed RNA polymerase specialized sigma24 family protein